MRRSPSFATLPGPMEDRTIERFIETRDAELFREIVETFQNRVFRLVASVLGPWADLDAEEITQDVFLRVYRKIDQFRGDSSFGSWLYRVAYTTALNHRESARIRFPHESDDRLVRVAIDEDPLATLFETATRRLVAGALESLPEVYRTVIYLYYWQECGVDEISDAIGAPPGTVKSYLHRARERVRRELGRHENHLRARRRS